MRQTMSVLTAGIYGISSQCIYIFSPGWVVEFGFRVQGQRLGLRAFEVQSLGVQISRFWISGFRMCRAQWQCSFRWLQVLGFSLRRFAQSLGVQAVLGGSWVVICGVMSPLIWIISIVTLLMTPVIT